MKNRVFAFFVAVFIATLNVHASIVTAEQAMQAAESWSGENAGAFGSSGSACGVIAEKDSSGNVLWYAVKMSDGGCIFITADSRIGPVLASVPNCDGNLPENHPLRALLVRDITSRLASVEKLESSSNQNLLAFTSSTSSSTSLDTISREVTLSENKWSRLTDGAVGKRQLLAFASSTVDGNPPTIIGYARGFALKMFTHWDQGASAYSKEYGEGLESSVLLPVYNYYTPYNWVCGCTATAGAALLQYFNITNGPVNVQKTCSVVGSATNMYTVGGHYNWDILPNTMGGALTNVTVRYSEHQRELMGRATYDFGVLLKSQYSSIGTGAFVSDIDDILKDYYGLKSAYSVALSTNIEDKEELDALFEKTIYAHLRVNEPVAMGIYSLMGGGHAVLAVGYGEDADKGRFTRVFMGWSGLGDAWYNLPSIGEYEIVADVIVMMSTNDCCVPVSGQVLMPDGNPASFATVTIPGVEKPVTTSGNGWFAARIPNAQLEGDIVATISNETGVATATALLSYLPQEEVDMNAIPDAFTIQLMDDIEGIPYYESPSAAAEAALAGGKAIVLFSGRNGEEKTEFIKKFLIENAEEFNEDFVLYYAEESTDSYGYRDAIPAIGFFAPSIFSPADSWAFLNGRLAFQDFTFIPTEEIEEDIFDMFETARSLMANMEHFEQAMADENKFKMIGGVKYSDLGQPYLGFKQIEDGTPVVGFGVYDCAYTNGENVVITAPESFTNSSSWSCAGWVLFDNKFQPSNEDDFLWQGEGSVTSEWAVAQGTTNVAKFQMPTNSSDLTLFWRWMPNKYRVTVSVINGSVVSMPGMQYDAGNKVWYGFYNYGETVPVVTTPKAASGYSFLLKQWDGTVSKDEIEGTMIHIFVNGERNVEATYQYPRDYDFVGTNTVTVDVFSEQSLPAGDEFPGTMCGTGVIANGASTNLFNVPVTLAPEVVSYTDSTGGVWECVGWTNGTGVVSAQGDSTFVSFTLTENSSFDWLWRMKENTFEIVTNLDWEVGLDNLSTSKEYVLAEAPIPSDFDLDDFELSVPTGWVANVSTDALTGDIVATLSLNTNALIPKAVGDSPVISIVPNADGTFAVNVKLENGLKGFWYAVYGANEIAGPYNLVKAYQATQDEDVAEISFSLTITPVEEKQFYKLVVTEFPDLVL